MLLQLLFLVTCSIAIIPNIHGNDIFQSTRPDKVLTIDCQYSGPIKLCLINREYKNINAEISYFGFLTDSPKPLSIFIKVNGNSGIFEMIKKIDNNIIKLNHLRNVHQCYHTGKIESYTAFSYPTCPNAECKDDDCTPRDLDWYFDEAPIKERQLFEAVSQEEGINIEIATTTADGRWDSLYGQNYHFNF